jgi:hypothetical protein
VNALNGPQHVRPPAPDNGPAFDEKTVNTSMPSPLRPVVADVPYVFPGRRHDDSLT